MIDFRALLLSDAAPADAVCPRCGAWEPIVSSSEVPPPPCTACASDGEDVPFAPGSARIFSVLPVLERCFGRSTELTDVDGLCEISVDGRTLSFGATWAEAFRNALRTATQRQQQLPCRVCGEPSRFTPCLTCGDPAWLCLKDALMDCQRCGAGHGSVELAAICTCSNPTCSAIHVPPPSLGPPPYPRELQLSSISSGFSNGVEMAKNMLASGMAPQEVLEQAIAQAAKVDPRLVPAMERFKSRVNDLVERRGHEPVDLLNAEMTKAVQDYLREAGEATGIVFVP